MCTVLCRAVLKWFELMLLFISVFSFYVLQSVQITVLRSSETGILRLK